MLNTKNTDYLDFIIKDGTVTPSDEKINAVKHFPILINQEANKIF